ncbi:MAG: hypothetical protein ACXACG_02215 [Candidatus Thorarchaeota archaeon]
MTQKRKKSGSSQNLRDILIKELTPRESKTKRNITVTTRLDEELVSMLDMLVTLGIFKSRSEAAATIIENTLFAQRDKFELLKSQISKLEKIQDKAMDIAYDVLTGN